MSYKLGSLFDGSGGFPLAGALCGIEPVWASEVEPYPIAVTKSRFKNMKHLGDISKINGAEIEPVDIITFGSPCQDLSVAGKRAGLKHEANGDEETTRSGLFIEAVRIIKEMRKATNGEYPRYAIWENVPGAFSSNKGEDFRVVLEELIKVVEPSAVMPEVPQKGWNYADCYTGDGWSLAYRVLDAQYWGVPQRRRRIYLVTDFRGECAKEILFERKGLRGYFTQGRTPWKDSTSYAEGSTRADDREGEVPYTLKIRSGVSVDSYGKAAGKGALIQENLSATLGTSQDQYLFQPVGPKPIAVATQQGGAEITENGVCPTITAAAGMSGNNQPWICLGADPYNGDLTGDKSSTLGVNCGVSTGRNGVIAIDKESYSSGSGFDRAPGITVGGPCATLQAQGVPHAVCYETVALGGNGQRPSHRGDGYSVTDKSYTLNTTEVHGVAYGLDAYNQALTGEKAKTLNSVATDSDHVPCTVYSVDQGGGKSSANVTEEKAPTLCTTHGGEPAVAYGIDHAITTGGNCTAQGSCVYKDIQATLKASGPHAVAYSVSYCIGNGQVHDAQRPDKELCKTLNCMDDPMKVCIQIERPVCYSQQAYDEFIENEVGCTLKARGGTYGGGSETLVSMIPSTAYGFDPGASRDVGALFIEECGKTITNGTCPGHHDGVVIATKPHYIVRRLTPTECARLQGFADRWGDIDAIDNFNQKDYRFWLEVRNTHARINGKKEQDYTVKQMLTWYNKLQTDSSEYKMWGNGIALPTALYVMQGVAEALSWSEFME